MAPLNKVRLLQGHIVAQVVEAKFVVCAVGDVRLILQAALIGALARNNAPCGHTQGTEDTPHQIGLVTGEIIVDRHDVDAPGRNRIQVGSQGRHQRLTLTGFHFGDVPEVQSTSTHQLNIKVAKTKRAL